MVTTAYANPVQIIAGYDSGLDSGIYENYEKIMLICDPAIRTTAYYDLLKKILKDKVKLEFSDIVPNPECDTVNQAVELARNNIIDCIVAIGGGSTLDLTKVVASICHTEGKAEDYLDGTRQLASRKAALILIPSTVGTGSEVTNVAVITDKKRGLKMPLVHNCLYGDYAIIDSHLTETLPARIIASSGLDALCHAVEAYWNNRSNQFSDALALYAIKSVLENLPGAYAGNRENRQEMGVAACIAGLAFNLTRTTVCHAISYGLTAVYGVDHGSACTLTLVPFLNFNYETIKDKLEVAAQFCGYDSAKALIEKISGLISEVNMPRQLRDYKIDEKDIAPIAEAAMKVGSVKFNPKTIEYDDIYSILQEIY